MLEKLAMIAMEGQKKAEALANLTDEEQKKSHLVESMRVLLTDNGLSSEEIELKIQLFLEGI